MMSLLSPRKSKLEKILGARFLRKCNDCELGRLSYPVSSRGNPQAKIVGVGEGSGLQEELQDLFFVGPAGIKLANACQYLNFPLDENFLLWNVVRCRPHPSKNAFKQNRQPTLAECQSCRKYLLQVVDHLQPKLIVMIGGVAMNNLMVNPKKVNQLKGSFISPKEMNVGNCPGFVLEHPASILRKPENKKEWLQHLIRIRDYAWNSN